ncbi:ferredoxin-nitrate reductase [Neolewinella xylanilytica]|uniref:Ferredoxin-nitrate reductase n=1 Tax=Neolewinella xylanilytica TaxID=1514080 RepID=A0A2S6IA68_9BACT|nr:nitrate reductase [Neolewinella xylanilytica]PPK88397.1 ferredoxin-nitrate reductase [Neolewinella xylanilytica]
MALNQVKTTCSYCGVGCGIIATRDGQDRLTVEGDPDHPANRGQLCSKGRNLNYVVQDRSDRLLYPQARLHRHHPLQRVSWDQALDRAAAVFRSIMEEHGPDSVAFYISGQCLTEEYYLVNKLTKGYLGTNNIDTNSRLCMSSTVVAYTKALGEDVVPGTYEDIDHTDCLFVAGANPAWCHPIIWRRVEARKAAHPSMKIIVVDPRRTDTCALADLHLQINPGTDVLLYHAIARRLYDTDRLDLGFIRDHTEADENYLRILKSLHLRSAAKTCGVSLDDIKTAANYIGDARAFMSMWAMGLNQSRVGVEKNGALINLHLLTGQIGKPGSGPFSLTGQPNAMGGREVGGMASLLAAHRVLANKSDREEVARFWGVDRIPAEPGLTATQMFDALESGKLKAIWIICTNPSVSLPNANHADSALRKAKFVVVQDISHRSDTADYADLLLPAAGWLEKTGTMTNSDRRVSYLQPLVPPPGEARPDADIICDFARRMGYSGFDYRDVSEVYDEYVRMTAGTHIDVSGLSHDRLRREGTFQWPVPSPVHPGTPRLFTDHRFYTPSGRARFLSTISHNEKPPVAPPDRPYILTTGRIRDQWHTMTRTGKVARLRRHMDVPCLDIHPLDAAAEKLEDNQLAVVHAGNGEVRVRIRYQTTLKRGVVFLPMHWGKTLGSSLTRANNLTDDTLDPYSKQPNFKFGFVGVKAYVKAREDILVIGAGAAAYRFIASYREHNTRDRITVFSREKNAFYNRVLLPEYVTEHLSWEQLEKIRERERQRLDFDLQLETSIERIDREHRVVYTAAGDAFTYDRLIIATGSRPFVPRDVPLQLPGVFTMRRREDADRLSHYLRIPERPRDAHVLIVGGGLLGLELAASMQDIGVRITLVQRSNRLMERQLDATASQLLAEDVGERGIQTYFRNEVDTIFPVGAGEGAGAREAMRVTFKSGISLVCNAVVYAIGTRPNLEVARTAGLKCTGGIVVDDRLTTSDAHVHAIGEVAEWRGKRFGITAAAEQQADVLAAYLSGDLSAVYEGSVPMNILKFRDLDLCSLGEVSVPSGAPGYEEVVFRDLSRRYYKKCVIYQDRLVGAVLIGDKHEFAEYRALIEDRIELGDRREELLRSAGSKEPVLGRVVCSCNNVGEGNLIKAVTEGCHGFNELVTRTGAGLGCGSCKPEVKSILDHQLASV